MMRGAQACHPSGGVKAAPLSKLLASWTEAAASIIRSASDLHPIGAGTGTCWTLAKMKCFLVSLDTWIHLDHG